MEKQTSCQYRSCSYKAEIILYHQYGDYKKDGYEYTETFYFRANNPTEAGIIVSYLMEFKPESTRFVLEEISDGRVFTPYDVDKIIEKVNTKNERTC